MSGQRIPPRPRPKSRTPAERAEEFTAIQRRLKQEAADRRDAAKAAEARRSPTRDGDSD